MNEFANLTFRQLRFVENKMKMATAHRLFLYAGYKIKQAAEIPYERLRNIKVKHFLEDIQKAHIELKNWVL